MKQIKNSNTKTNKKAVSEIITTVILIMLVITAIIIVWVMVKNVAVLKGPTPQDCLLLLQSTIKNACYEQREIKIIISRGLDNFALDKIRFMFSPAQAIWDIKGTKCLDARLNDREYGGYCDILQAGETLTYVVNAEALEKQDEITILFYADELACEIGKETIKPQC
ncbi:MAG: archaellin/type IV pilin N-terminal domain-containing protein [Nanoarchaeota archaeon]